MQQKGTWGWIGVLLELLPGLRVVLRLEPWPRPAKLRSPFLGGGRKGSSRNPGSGDRSGGRSFREVVCSTSSLSLRTRPLPGLKLFLSAP